MMPGINPKQMKAAMRKMGMQMNEIENVTKVVVYTASETMCSRMPRLWESPCRARPPTS